MDTLLRSSVTAPCLWLGSVMGSPQMCCYFWPLLCPFAVLLLSCVWVRCGWVVAEETFWSCGGQLFLAGQPKKSTARGIRWLWAALSPDGCTRCDLQLHGLPVFKCRRRDLSPGTGRMRSDSNPGLQARVGEQSKQGTDWAMLRGWQVVCGYATAKSSPCSQGGEQTYSLNVLLVRQ